MKEELFLHFERAGALSGLSETQINKFKFACEKAVAENPGLGFNDLCIACRVYLNFISDSPDIDLGPIRMPKRPD
jgi:hypothetical protein